MWRRISVAYLLQKFSLLLCITKFRQLWPVCHGPLSNNSVKKWIIVLKKIVGCVKFGSPKNALNLNHQPCQFNYGFYALIECCWKRLSHRESKHLGPFAESKKKKTDDIRAACVNLLSLCHKKKKREREKQNDQSKKDEKYGGSRELSFGSCTSIVLCHFKVS